MKYLLYTFSLALMFQGCGDSTKKTPSTSDVNGTSSVGSFIDLPLNPTFSRVDSDIVKENRSNLYWQDNDAAKTTIKTLPAATSYCAGLTLSGLTEWRLPTYKELMTLVTYDREKPAIYDTFVYTAKEEYWSSTTSARSVGTSGTSKSWAIDFDLGSTRVDFFNGFTTSNKYVRCVNDSLSNKRVADVNFTRESNIVTDNIHNLEWQDEVGTKVNLYDFSEAQSYCSALTLDTKTGWRVPTIKELLSIHDVTDFDASTHNDFLYTAYNKPYRSSKERVGDTYGWTLTFADGKISYSGQTDSSTIFDYYVRCVRDKN